MNKLLKKLHAFEAALEEEVLDRQELFDKRSEKWQESEKGELYAEMTDCLTYMQDGISDLRTVIEEYVSNQKQL